MEIPSSERVEHLDLNYRTDVSVQYLLKAMILGSNSIQQRREHPLGDTGKRENRLRNQVQDAAGSEERWKKWQGAHGNTRDFPHLTR